MGDIERVVSDTLATPLFAVMVVVEEVVVEEEEVDGVVGDKPETKEEEEKGKGSGQRSEAERFPRKKNPKPVQAGLAG